MRYLSSVPMANARFERLTDLAVAAHTSSTTCRKPASTRLLRSSFPKRLRFRQHRRAPIPHRHLFRLPRHPRPSPARRATRFSSLHLPPSLPSRWAPRLCSSSSSSSRTNSNIPLLSAKMPPLSRPSPPFLPRATRTPGTAETRRAVGRLTSTRSPARRARQARQATTASTRSACVSRTTRAQTRPRAP